MGQRVRGFQDGEGKGQRATIYLLLEQLLQLGGSRALCFHLGPQSLSLTPHLQLSTNHIGKK